MVSVAPAKPDAAAPRRMDAGATLSVASYNIHSGVGLDRHCSSGRIVRVLKELDCDLYALQEVDNQPGDHEESLQLERFARDMDMTAVPGLRIVRHTGEYGNAIVTRLPVLNVRRHDLSHSWFEPRGALDIQVEVAGAPLRVIATHLGLRRSERKVQWRALMSHLAEAPPDMPTILLGDMNEWYRPAATLREAHRAFGEPPAPVGFPSFAPCLALTRIWVKPRIALQSVTVHRSETARRASDHLPVRAQIDVDSLKTG
ncbi:endonuclease/exonuclease/phosphatase family protein [Povalibacter sp.]|uniref:endonuclease/exonuclease/phosphatase family protein n=1 Tax=Povalibacter sp. TaxID=1962978 RepID=UPI002F3EFF9A